MINFYVIIRKILKSVTNYPKFFMLNLQVYLVPCHLFGSIPLDKTLVQYKINKFHKSIRKNKIVMSQYFTEKFELTLP